MLAQIYAILHDLDGDGDPTAGAGTTAYNAAFPDRVTAASGRMGCAATCTGYELMNNLDFDTGMAGDRTDDTYYNGGAGWTPHPGHRRYLDIPGHLSGQRPYHRQPAHQRRRDRHRCRAVRLGL